MFVRIWLTTVWQIYGDAATYGVHLQTGIVFLSKFKSFPKLSVSITTEHTTIDYVAATWADFLEELEDKFKNRDVKEIPNYKGAGYVGWALIFSKKLDLERVSLQELEFVDELQKKMVTS